MSDGRIAVLLDAVRALGRGERAVPVEVPGSDDVAELGRALAQAARVMEERYEELRRLAAVTEVVNSGMVLDEVLDRVYDSFRTLLPYDRIGFSLIDDGGRTLTARWARSEAPELHIARGYSAELAGSSLAPLLTTLEPRIIDDLEVYLAQHPDSESTQRIVAEGMRSSLTVPLVALGRPVGFMFFTSMARHTYTRAHAEVFRQVAGQLAVCVEKGRLYQQLVELNEMKGRFLGMAAHDLRNPIAVVRGYVDLFRDDALPAEQRRGVLDVMDRACGEMLALISDLLDFAAIEEGRLVLDALPIQVGAWLAQSLSGMRLLAARKGIAVEVSVAADVGSAVVDPRRLDQVLANLFSNALKFSPAGTTVTVRVARNRGDLVLEVRDQGAGIGPEDLGKLFTRFGKAAARPTAGEASTGLGLAITKAIVQAHGGDVSVQSQPGVGSCFTVRIPADGPGTVR